MHKIGNYTSQYFANIYLNELDHYIKEKLKIKYYIRYMDDFVLLIPSKKEAQNALAVIASYLKANLNLELNRKSRYYPNHFGCNFCGYKIYEEYILLRKRFKKKIKRKVRIWNYYYMKDELNVKRVQLQWNSCLGHASHANSYHFMKKTYASLKCTDYLKKIS